MKSFIDRMLSRRGFRHPRASLLVGICLMTFALGVILQVTAGRVERVQDYVPMESLWDLEDERQESETLLVSALRADGIPLGYDEELQTFYCPLPSGMGDDWPEIRLTVEGETGVQVCFADEYYLDSCRDAVADGTAYHLFAWTEDAFSWFDLVFTGLPMVVIETKRPITVSEGDCQVAVSDGTDAISMQASIHRRGAISRGSEKGSYTVKFLRGEGGKKAYAEVPGMGQERKFVLLPMIFDRLMMREKLSWKLWSELLSEDMLYGSRKAQYVELFLNDNYEGVYLMAEKYDSELEFSTHAPERFSSVYKVIALSSHTTPKRPRIAMPGWEEAGYELRYSAKEDPWQDLEPWLALCTEEDDRRFARMVEERVDIDSLLRYMLFVQACGMTDNFRNNMFFGVQTGADGVTYRFFPWDLDFSWGEQKFRVGYEFDVWQCFPPGDRILNLNAAGARQRFAALWQDMRREVMTQEHVETLVTEFAEMLRDSGAARRNVWRWGMGDEDPDGSELVTFASVRFPWLDARVAEIMETEGSIPYLADSAYRDDPEETVQEDGLRTSGK